MNPSPSPVSIIVYDRVEHLQQCVNSLLQNPMSSATTLFVNSDGPRSGEEERVERVRRYAKEIRGFKKVVLNFHESNNRRQNARGAFTSALEEFGSAIVMEDDNVVSRTFLEFMSSAIHAHRDKSRLIGVSGYCPPINLHRRTSKSLYLSRFFSAWTMGVWDAGRIISFLDQPEPFSDMIRSGSLDRVRALHPKLAGSLRAMQQGSHEAADQKLSYYMIEQDLFQLKPTKTLVRNIGNDGSGLHSPVSRRFDQPPNDVPLDVQDVDWTYRPSIDRAQYRYFYKKFTSDNLRRHYQKVISLGRGAIEEG